MSANCFKQIASEAQRSQNGGDRGEVQRYKPLPVQLPEPAYSAVDHLRRAAQVGPGEGPGDGDLAVTPRADGLRHSSATILSS